MALRWTYHIYLRSAHAKQAAHSQKRIGDTGAHQQGDCEGIEKVFKKESQAYSHGLPEPTRKGGLIATQNAGFV